MRFSLVCVESGYTQSLFRFKLFGDAGVTLDKSSLVGVFKVSERLLVRRDPSVTDQKPREIPPVLNCRFLIPV